MIIADTTSCLTSEILKSTGIVLIPQLVIFGEETFHDAIELNTTKFLAKLKDSRELPKTAAPPPQYYFSHYERAQEKNEAVVVIAPSAKVSGTVRSAEVAALEFPRLEVHVIDTTSAAGNVASLVLLAHEWSGNGATADQIITRLQEWIPRCRTYFLVNTLEYLQKGGRIGGAKAFLGELLQVKPILCLGDGQVQPFEQYRTRGRALRRLIEVIDQECPKNPDAFPSVLYGGALAEAEELAATLKIHLGLTDIPIYELPPSLLVHGGPGVLAVAFFTTKAL